MNQLYHSAYTPNRKLDESESVFGMAKDINATAAATVFIGLIFLLVCLELGFSRLEHWAEHHQAKELFEKLKKELTMMGILSFTVFIYETSYSDATNNDYYEAFEMSHIVILFIAVAFIIQASFLLHFAIREGDNFLKMSRTTATDLLLQYREMKKSSSCKTWFFEKAPFWFAIIPSFRNQIRSKLIESLFIKQHKLPDEFRFAQYISKLFQKYISELGDVSPINWLLLGSLVAINFGKIKWLDQYETQNDCGFSPGEPIRRLLQESGDSIELICFDYVFNYALLVLFFLFLFVIGVYIASAHYFEKLLRIACAREGVIVTKETGRQGYIQVLELMAKREDILTNDRTKSTSSSASDHVRSALSKPLGSASKDMTHAQQSSSATGTHLLTLTNPLFLPLIDDSNIAQKGNDDDYDDHERKDIREALIEEQMDELHEIEVEEKERANNSFSLKCVCRRLLSCFKSDEDKGSLQNIFWLKSSGLFFSMVEFVLLLQCLYMAIWATQLIPMVVLYDQNQFGWVVAFTAPMFVNFLLIRMVLSRSVMLQAICGVHAEVLGEVKEEAIEEEHCLDKLRDAVRHRFAHLHDKGGADANTPSQAALTLMKSELKEFFNKYDDDGSGDIGVKEFLLLLTDLKVYISKRAFKILWQAIDYDLSGGISWDELFIILFPELKALMKKELLIVGELQSAISDKLRELGINDRGRMSEYLQQEFQKYDADHSGCIDETEMLVLVREYLPDMDAKKAKRLFAAIDVDGEGGIEWDEFKALTIGVEQKRERRRSTWT